jgi:Fe-S cluster assembly protein SufD
MLKNIITTDQSTALLAMRGEAASRFQELPELALVYGQNIFFDAKKAVVPFHAEPTLVHPTVTGPDSIRILTLADALADEALNEDILGALAARSFHDDKAFHWMLSRMQDALVVAIPAGTRLSAPILLQTGCADEAALQHVIVHAGKDSSVNILDRRFGGPGFLGTICDIVAGENASVQYAVAQTREKTSVHASYVRVFGERRSAVGLHEAHGGGSYVRARAVGHLHEEGATFTADAGHRGDAARNFDYHCEGRHEAPRTVSRIRTALVLADTAKGVARAMTRITQDAKGSDARQRIDAMLLSERAEADTVPQLEIGTDEVSCKHGASTGRPDAAMRFYLESRGLSPEEARQVLIDGHFGKLFTDLTDESISAVLRETLAN